MTFFSPIQIGWTDAKGSCAFLLVHFHGRTCCVLVEHDVTDLQFYQKELGRILLRKFLNLENEQEPDDDSVTLLREITGVIIEDGDWIGCAITKDEYFYFVVHMEPSGTLLIHVL